MLAIEKKAKGEKRSLNVTTCKNKSSRPNLYKKTQINVRDNPVTNKVGVIKPQIHFWALLNASKFFLAIIYSLSALIIQAKNHFASPLYKDK